MLYMLSAWSGEGRLTGAGALPKIKNLCSEPPAGTSDKHLI